MLQQAHLTRKAPRDLLEERLVVEVAVAVFVHRGAKHSATPVLLLLPDRDEDFSAKSRSTITLDGGLERKQSGGQPPRRTASDGTHR